MNGFALVKKPNLPKNRVCAVVVSSQYPEVLKALSALSATAFTVSSCEDLLLPVSQHTDMLFSYLGNGSFICEKSQKNLKSALGLKGFNCIDEVELSTDYPADIVLNSCIIDSSIICNEKYTPEVIKNKFQVIDVKQGYAKCSCAVVDESSVITDDESVAAALRKNKFDVLLVDKGSVRLQGFEYGFIGGCCGKLSKDTMAFCGDIHNHANYRQIDAFLRERKVYPVSLLKGELLDIGSIIPVLEVK